ncbi:MAG: glycosyltransferase family 2 protein [Deltaproteobacteria bacterium]|nr:glycosyltransferase family 2 protein [Deltaproteobacteria bacterium]
MSVDISIIIINWNTRDLLLQCLSSIQKTVWDAIAYEVWVVDNASSDGSSAAVRERFPHTHLIQNRVNEGFAVANNRALEKMAGRYALLLNTDAELTPDAVRTLYTFMETHPHAAMACGQLLNPDGSKQNSIANFPSFPVLLFNETLLRILFPRRFPSKRKDYKAPMEIESCIGACMMVRKSAMDQVGLLDERYFFFLEETDWAYRMKRAGLNIYFVPSARIFHAQGKSVKRRLDGRILFYRSRYAFFKKWRPRMYPLIGLIVFIRLCINILLSAIALASTLGFKKDLNQRCKTYIRLFVWHLKGCP